MNMHDLAMTAAILMLVLGTGLGLAGLLAPHWTSRLVRLTPASTHPDGFAEFRSTYGAMLAGLHGAGLACALGLVPIAGAALVAFGVLGIGWIATALGRTLSLLMDGTNSAFMRICVVFELVVGSLLLLPLVV